MTTTNTFPITNLAELRLRNAEAGGHYFDADTCRFFGSRFGAVFPLPDGGALLMESQRDRSGWAFDGKRVYTWRAFDAEGHARIDATGDFLPRAGAALREAREWARAEFGEHASHI